MRIFISFGFWIISLWIVLFAILTMKGLATGNIIFADKFTNGLLSGVVIMAGLLSIDKGIWIDTSNNNKNNKYK